MVDETWTHTGEPYAPQTYASAIPPRPRGIDAFGGAREGTWTLTVSNMNLNHARLPFRHPRKRMIILD